jgi:hypothetical protein
LMGHAAICPHGLIYGLCQKCQEPSPAEKRLALARQAIIDVGYFKPGEVDDDVAPRIVEYASFMRQRLEVAHRQTFRLPSDTRRRLLDYWWHHGGWMKEAGLNGAVQADAIVHDLQCALAARCPENAAEKCLVDHEAAAKEGARCYDCRNGMHSRAHYAAAIDECMTEWCVCTDQSWFDYVPDAEDVTA